MRLVWDSNACEDCLWWQDHDRNVLKRINLLLQTSCTTATRASASPSPWGTTSPATGPARITDEHRLVYKVTESEVRIAACRYHYGR